MVIDGDFGLALGAITTPLIGALGVLWKAWGAERDRADKMQIAFDAYRDKSQEKYNELSNKQTELQTRSLGVLENSQKTIDALVNAVNSVIGKKE